MVRAASSGRHVVLVAAVAAVLLMLVALMADLADASTWISTICFLGMAVAVLTALFAAEGRPVQQQNAVRASLGTALAAAWLAIAVAATIATR